MNFANLFVETDAGELLYFLMTVGLSLAGLLMALDQWTRGPRETEAFRYMVALIGVVMAWILLTLSSLNAILDVTDFADTIYPPAERVTTTLVIVLLSWAFLTAESPRSERGSFIALMIILITLLAGLGYTLVEWNDAPATAEFNQHRLGEAWTFIPVVLSVAAMLLLLTRYRFAADIPLKLLFFVLILLGHGVTLYEIRQNELDGNFAGLIRLSMLVALALLPVFLYRLVLDRFRNTVGEVTGFIMPSEMPRLPNEYFAPPPAATGKIVDMSNQEALSLLKILGMMLEKTLPEDIPIQIIKAVADSFKTDVVALAVPQNANWADTLAVYDFIREHTKPGMALNLANQPTLSNAIETLNLRMLLPGEHEFELNDLFHRLDVNEAGPVGPAYFQPLSRERKVIGVLMLVMPYTSRLLTNEEKQFLGAIAPIAARLLALSQEAFKSKLEAEEVAIQRMVGGGIVSEVPASQEDRFSEKVRAELQADLEAAREQINQLTIYVSNLQQQLSREQDKLHTLAGFSSDAMSITQKINVISSERDKLNREREELLSTLESANALIAGATADTDERIYREMMTQLEQEKQDLLETKARLEAELSQYQAAPADPNTLGEILVTITAERDRLVTENQQIQSQMQQVTDQLAELGFENSNVGIGQLIAHLTEERTKYEKVARRARSERDILLRERNTLSQQRDEEKERSTQIDNLQKEVSRLASEREILTRQRDALKVERDALNQQRDQWLESRISLTQQYESLRQQYAQLQHQLTQTRVGMAGADPDAQAYIQQVEIARQTAERDLMQARSIIQKMEREFTQLQTTGFTTTREERITAENIIVMAQEIRTPATSIIGYADLMLSESIGILSPLQRQFLVRVQANAERLKTALEALVNMLQLDFGTMQLETQAIHIQDVIDDAITDSTGRYREKGLTLLLQAADNLPTVQADYDAVQQILTQLLVNAHLASPPDSVVEVDAQFVPQVDINGQPIDAVVFSVADQGGGIDPALQSKIFTRIYRKEAPLIPGLGDNGVGLSIAYALVNAHGGKIWFESRVGEGTTFKVAIPIDQKLGSQPIVKNSIHRLIEVFKDEPLS